MNILVKTTLSSILVIGIVACTGNTTNMAAKNDADSGISALQLTPKHLEFIGTSVFDSQLSDAMKNKHYEIQVSMLTPFSTNDVPKKLDTWLTAINNFGGEVKIEPVEKTRGFMASIALTLLSAYKEYSDQQKYEI